MFYEKEADGRYHFLLARRSVDENGERYLSPAHFHDSFEFLIVTRGEVLASVNGEQTKIHEGEILFVDSCDIHTIDFFDCSAYSLVFSRHFCRQFCDGEMTLPSHPVCDNSGFSRIISRVGFFYDSGEKENKLFCESLIAYVLGVLSEQNEYVLRSKDKPRQTLISLIDYLNKNYKDDIKLSDAASKFGYAPSYFSKIFNKFIRMSFSDYLNLVRYRKTLELLESDKNIKITDAAMRCGFGSMNTFYRAKSKIEKGSLD